MKLHRLGPVSQRERTLQWWIFALTAVAVAAVNLSTRRQCERVLPYSTTPSWRFETVRDGRIYLSLQDQAGVMVRSYPAGGGPGKLVVREVPEQEPGDRMYNLKVQADRLLYVLEADPSSNQGPLKRVRMLRLSGGAPETVLAEKGSLSIGFGSNVAYIVVPHTRPERGRPEPARDLWIQSLPRGPKRRLGIVPRGSPVSLGDVGVSYTVREDPNYSLVLLRETDQEIRKYADFEADTRLETADGLLWIRDRDHPQGGARRTLYKTDYNTAKRVTISEWPIVGIKGGVKLVGQRGDFVYFLTSNIAVRPIPGFAYRHSLWRIRQSRKDQAAQLAMLPCGAQGPGVIDGDYYYFDCREPRENWFDWSPDGLRSETAASVQRFRLPSE